MRERSIPTPIIYGDRDLWSHATAQETHRAMRGSGAICLADVGQMIYANQTTAFLRAALAQ